jgi:predicted acylesterase/phospholipase RssA
LYSRKINQLTDTTLSIVDITMASSAVPLVFPSVRIRNVKTIPDVKYIDGSVGDDHVPYKALLEFQKYRNRNVEKVFIISRKSDSIPNLGDELRNLGFDNIKTPDRFGLTVENILKRDIIRKLMDFEQEAPELRGRIYVWIPDFEKDFLLFNFDNLKEQYDLTLHWSKTHNPVALEEFLNPYRKNEKSLDSLLMRPLSRLKLKIRNP